MKLFEVEVEDEDEDVAEKGGEEGWEVSIRVEVEDEDEDVAERLP